MSKEQEAVEVVQDYDPVKDRKLLWKIDLNLIPLFCMVYAVQFMGKVSNASGGVLGIRRDLNMDGDKFAWTGTAFFLGFLLFVFPANTILQRFPPAKVTAIFIISWGIVQCLLSAPNYAGYIFLRILLGVLESVVSPAMVIILSQWYRKEEQFLRTAFWVSSNGLGIIIGGLISYGVAINEYSIESWKIMFIVTGLMAILIGIIFVIHIPDLPTNAWFLNEGEKQMVIERIKVNKNSNGTSSKKHF